MKRKKNKCSSTIGARVFVSANTLGHAVYQKTRLIIETRIRITFESDLAVETLEFWRTGALAVYAVDLVASAAVLAFVWIRAERLFHIAERALEARLTVTLECARIGR